MFIDFINPEILASGLNHRELLIDFLIQEQQPDVTLDQGGPRLRARRPTLRLEETFAGRKERNFIAIKRFVCCSNRPNFDARLMQFFILG